MIFKLALKEITYNKKFSLFFIFNVTLALMGLIVIDNFKFSFADDLSKRGKEILGSDISLSARYALSDQKLNGFYKRVGGVSNIKKSLVISMFTMGQLKEETPRLVSMQILDGIFPFYGNVSLSSLRSLKSPGLNEVWLSEDALGKYKVSEVKSMSLGGSRFKISDVVIRDGQQSFGMGSVAPRIYLNARSFEKTNLLQKGSTVRYNYHVKTSTVIDQELLKDITDFIDDNSVSVITPQKSSEQVGRLMAYLTDFLGLVSLVAMFLSSIGLFYLFRSHMTKKEKSFAILSSIGMTKSVIRKVYVTYTLLLVVIGVLSAEVFSACLIPLIKLLFSGLVTFKLPSMIHGSSLLLGLYVGFIGILLLILPLLSISLSKKLATLFEQFEDHSTENTFKWVIYYLPYLLFFTTTSIYVANSIRIGGWFIVCFFAVALLTYPLFSVLLKFAYKKGNFLSLEKKLSIRYLYRYRKSTLTIFLSLTLGTMLLNVIPQMESSLRGDLNMSENEVRPEFFLFDIQDEQVASLKTFLEKNDQKIVGLSPMIRARLTKINNVAVVASSKKALTREQQREQAFRNRGVNLSYRDGPDSTEKILEGKPILNEYDEKSGDLPKLSIEKRFAGRLKLKKGDKLEFNILGVPQLAIIENLRSVRWTSFVPNFFIRFQKGVLEDAPKSWLTGIKATNGFNQDIKFLLYEKFPNVSIINISNVINRILEIITQMTFALKAMSFLCLIVGFSVLYAVISHQVHLRKNDTTLLHLVGMKSESLRSMLRFEFSLIVMTASSLGALFGILVSFFLSYLFFDGVWHGSIFVPLVTVGASLFMSHIILRLIEMRSYD